ncbi:MAG: ABC transporter ATP-binding protein [Bacteroidota bacterium]
MKPVIEISQLGKKYRIRKAEPYLALRDAITDSFKYILRKKNNTKEDFWALQDINLAIEQGERVGIIGRNGAGKSTLLKILSRITWPTTGQAIIRGRLASLLEVGTGFHPELTGKENIYLNGSILGLKKREIDKQFDAIVDFSGVEKFIDMPLKNYSSGMQLRLAFSVAAHLEPEILLIDEVLAVGDAEFQKKCIGKMEEVSKNHGRTIIFVSHNMASLQNFCTKGVLLENGIIREENDINAVINTYLSNTLKQKLKFSERKDRIGNGQVKIVNVTLLNETGIRTGESLKVEIEYASLTNNIEVTEFGVSIWDNNEGKIISLSSTFKNQLHQISKSGKVVCEIPYLPLVNGSYLLNAFVSSLFGIEDYIERIFEFDVHENDIFGTGKIVDPEWGKIAVEHNWFIQNDTK